MEDEHVIAGPMTRYPWCVKREREAARECRNPHA